MQKTPGGFYFVEGRNGQPGRSFSKLRDAQAYDQELDRFGRVCEIKSTTRLLIELYEDVERWREEMSDTNLRYLLETAEKLTPQAVAAIKEES